MAGLLPPPSGPLASVTMQQVLAVITRDGRQAAYLCWELDPSWAKGLLLGAV